MKQKKIIVFMPSIEGGGVEKNLYLIINFLNTKFKEINLITASQNITKIDKTIKIINPSLKNFFSNNRNFKILISSISLFLFLLRNKNILILSFQANLYSILIAKIFNIKIIVRLNASPTGWIKNNLKKYIFKKIYSKATAIIVNSNEFKKELYKKLNLKSYCIYNPLDKANIINKSKIKIKVNPFKNLKSLKLINIGRLVEQKDHITLLKSIQNIKDKLKIKLIIIGQGKNKKKLLRFIKLKKLSKIVKILNYKINPYPYLKLSDLFILTSKYEGLPNVLLEAMTLKKFIISSDCPTGPREILGNGKFGLLFKTGSHEDLSKKIIDFYYNKEKYLKKTNDAYKSLYKYNYEKNLYKYLNLINGL